MSPAEIKKKYYELAKKYHPDVNKGNDEMFKKISKAYEVLGDQERKSKVLIYNNFRYVR